MLMIEMEMFSVKVLSVLADFVGILDWIWIGLEMAV